MTNARTLTLGLSGKWHRSYGVAPCPICQTERRRDQDALTLTDGDNGLLLHCKRLGCGFRDILAAAGIAPRTITPPDPVRLAQREAERRAEAGKRAAQAQWLWQEAQPITGTAAETYLRGRGILCDLPPVLRFHPQAWHGPTARRLPALVARVEGGDGFAAHRTWLRPDGSGKAAVDPPKAMLGAVAGGAVRLSAGPGPLVATEGIETALSLACGMLSGPAAIWSTLSTSGMRGLILPTKPERLTIATDGDGPGRAAGNDLATRAHALGWKVSMLPAPDGHDWNDVLMGKVAQ